MYAFLQQPNINPVILPLGNVIALRWYSLMYMVAFLFVFLFVLYHIKKKIVLMTEERFSDILFVAILGVLLGARLGYVLFYNLDQYIKEPLKIFAVWEGGMSFHGGFIGLLIGTFIYTKIKKMNMLDVGDLLAIPAPLGLAFGRWGNFVNGELWGRPTTSPLGMIFKAKPQISNHGPRLFRPDEIIQGTTNTARQMAEQVGIPVIGNASINLPRHMSQIYEMCLEGILLFIVMIVMMKLVKNRNRGTYVSLFFLGYGLSRFIVEFFREPDVQLGFLLKTNWLTMGMILSLPMIVIGIVGLVLTYIFKVKNELWAE